MKSRVKYLSSTAAFACLVPFASAQAHPHVFVSVQTVIQVSDGQVTGLQHAWTFDEFYASDAVTGLDVDKNGKYSKEELNPLAVTNMAGLKEFDYFTTAAAAGKPLKFGEPVDYWLEFTSGLLTLHYTLPLMQPLPTRGDVMTFSVEDPSYYIAFAFANEDAISFSSSILNGCKAFPVVDPLSDEQQQLASAFSGQIGAEAGAAAGGQTNASADAGNTRLIRCPP